MYYNNIIYPSRVKTVFSAVRCLERKEVQLLTTLGEWKERKTPFTFL